MIGQGGFSKVYLAQNIKNNNIYAIKITTKKAKANSKVKIYDIVQDEINILKRIHSKYIVKIYNIIDTEDNCYIVMEYMSNGSLLSIINSDNFTQYMIWRYFRHIIMAVEYCHEIAKICHKDINVNNLLISNDNLCKLNDFGISFIFNQNDLLPASGPATYSPPEKIFTNEKYYHGKPADIYLIGLTLYHMIFKEPLFKNFGNLTKEDYTNINFEYFYTNEFTKNMDIELLEILKSLLKFDPKERPTIQELKNNKWVTQNGEFKIPDVNEETLNYFFEQNNNIKSESNKYISESDSNDSYNNDDENYIE
jgi:serine/threonine protein kinase